MIAAADIYNACIPTRQLRGHQTPCIVDLRELSPTNDGEHALYAPAFTNPLSLVGSLPLDLKDPAACADSGPGTGG